MLTWAATGVQAADYLKKTGHVNTYTFTKMLTEMAIGEHHNSSFPVAIVRPSIVVSPPGLRVSLIMRRSRCREDVQWSESRACRLCAVGRSRRRCKCRECNPTLLTEEWQSCSA